MDNPYVLSLLFWPAVLLVCAGINMLVTWTFSWSELIFDYAIGVVVGVVFFVGTQSNAGGAELFFLVFSHGLFGLLWAASDGFQQSVGSAETFCWMLAGVRVGATLWSAAWDRVSSLLGAKLDWGPFFFSLLVAPAKLPFALVTSAIGLLIWLAGMFWAIFGSGKAGFAGGVFFAEFSPGTSGHHATTLGFTVHTWFGNTPLTHELYHTRQYIYMCDWLIPFWVLGTLWGLISAAAAKLTVSPAVAFGADSAKKVGNPIEIAAYHI